jgi:hypothetical protein
MLSGKQERDAAEITEAAIRKRAKENAEKDGVAWQAEMTPRAKQKFMPLVRALDEEGRRNYLKKAKTELLKEKAE